MPISDIISFVMLSVGFLPCITIPRLQSKYLLSIVATWKYKPSHPQRALVRQGIGYAHCEACSGCTGTFFHLSAAVCVISSLRYLASGRLEAPFLLTTASHRSSGLFIRYPYPSFIDCSSSSFMADPRTHSRPLRGEDYGRNGEHARGCEELVEQYKRGERKARHHLCPPRNPP